MDWWEFLLVMALVLPITVLWIGCIIDIISRPDLSGWAKALWMVGVLFFPLFGSLIYVIVRPRIVVGGPVGAFDETWVSPDTVPRAGT
jgi:hypothetical protein